MIRTLALTVLACAWLAGCSSIEKPRAEVVAVQAGAVSDEGAVVEFTMLLVNPNDVALPVKKVRYEVALAGRTFRFDATPPVAIPVYGQQMFTLPASFATGGAPITGQTVDVAGRVYYQPPGKVREALSDMKIPLPHVSFESTVTLE